ncbi:MAG: LacI family DNA-binding transcriptional regulator [Lachnospiraceae bacterium]|nr:LacI family DNA-binding transcriptional regulator [Lachnospiraceae bacterium]
MVSIKDVAKHAGVAVSTVSKVLNHYPNISEETRIKVATAVEQLQFVPNTVAAALSSKQAGRAALLIHLNNRTQAIDEISLQYIAGAIHEAKERKLDIITIFFSMIEEMSPEELTVYLKSQNITGLIICGTNRECKALNALVEKQIFKTVMVDAPLINESTSCVWVNQKQAQMEVARKTILENNGHRVLYLTGKKNGYVAELRAQGMEELAKELSLQLMVKCGNFSELQARKLTFDYGKDRDVIVCASDLMAIGAMRALTEMDIFRPVCGFDGITLMGYAGKQMNTVRQDFYGIAARAVEELQYLMRDGVGREVLMPYTLVRLKYEDIIC